MPDPTVSTVVASLQRAATAQQNVIDAARKAAEGPKPPPPPAQPAQPQERR